jgi:hypothetical protein
MILELKVLFRGLWADSVLFMGHLDSRGKNEDDLKTPGLIREIEQSLFYLKGIRPPDFWVDKI